MIHILILILKSIVQIILMSIAGFCLVLMALLLWDIKFMEMAEDCQSRIWIKRIK